MIVKLNMNHVGQGLKFHLNKSNPLISICTWPTGSWAVVIGTSIMHMNLGHDYICTCATTMPQVDLGPERWILVVLPMVP